MKNRDDKILNPATGRYVLKTGKIGKKILDDMEKNKGKAPSPKGSPKKASTSRKCPPEKVLNPKTNNCVLKTGKIGKKILEEESLRAKKKNKSPEKTSPKASSKKKAPPPDKILNPKSGKYVLKTGKIGKAILEEEARKNKPQAPPQKDASPKKSSSPLERPRQPYSYVPPKPKEAPKKTSPKKTPPKPQPPPPKQAPPKIPKQSYRPFTSSHQSQHNDDPFEAFRKAYSSFFGFNKQAPPKQAPPPPPQFQNLKPEEGFGNLDKAFPNPDDLRFFRSSKIMTEAHNILGVKYNATKPEIKKAYFKLAQKYHPDKGGDGRIFSKISSAWKYIEDNM